MRDGKVSLILFIGSDNKYLSKLSNPIEDRNHRFLFCRICMTKVKDVLRMMKIKKAVGPDEIIEV